MPVLKDGLHEPYHRAGLVVQFIRCPNLSESAVETFKEPLYRLADRPGAHDLYLDFSTVTFLAARALGMLVKLHQKLAGVGARLVVYNVHQYVYEVFEITRLNCLFDVHRQGDLTRPSQDEPKTSEKRKLNGVSKEGKVLIVERNADTALRWKSLFEGEGRHTDIACDGEEAIKRLSIYRPDTIVLDFGLPKIDGHQVAERIRGLNGDDVRIIAVTGHGEPESLHRAMSARVDYFLVKPIDPKQLVALVMAT